LRDGALALEPVALLISLLNVTHYHVNKKVNYRKQIARHSRHQRILTRTSSVFDSVNIFLTDHRAKVGCCFSNCVSIRTCRMSQKFRGRWAQPPWGGAWLTPLETRCSPPVLPCQLWSLYVISYDTSVITLTRQKNLTLASRL